MKKLFFLGILGFGVLWLLGFCLYRVGLALLDVYDDYQLAKELKEIEAATAEKRRQQRRDEPTTERQRVEQMQDRAEAALITEASEANDAPTDETPVDDV